MRLALNVTKMAKEGFSCSAIEERQFPIKKPRAKIQVEKKRGVEFPEHQEVQVAIERHPAMLRHNLTAGCHPCQNRTAKNLQTRW